MDERAITPANIPATYVQLWCGALLRQGYAMQPKRQSVEASSLEVKKGRVTVHCLTLQTPRRRRLHCLEVPGRLDWLARHLKDVAFLTLTGRTAAVATCEASHVRPVGRRGITHARELEVA
ncbi:MAG: hypothetical protein HY736_02640 [Verrucomicrobia bacterium]|nr:hypothetical protein [Verrucomicrobiota bacterium]